MKIEEYEAFHANTSMEVLDNDLGWQRVAMGCMTECGEIIGALKHVSHDGLKLDRSELVEELGDMTWYLALGVRLAGFRLAPTISAAALHESKMTLSHSLFEISNTLYSQVYFQIGGIRNMLDVRGSSYIAMSGVTATLGVVLHLARRNQIEVEQILAANASKITARFGGGWSPAAVAAKADKHADQIKTVIHEIFKDESAQKTAAEHHKAYAGGIW